LKTDKSKKIKKIIRIRMDASIGLQTTRKLLYWLKASLLNEERLLSKVPLIGPIKPIDP